MRIPGISNAVLVGASPVGYHSLAMTVDHGTNGFWAWGRNDHGQVGNGTNANNEFAPVPLQFCTRCQRCIQLGSGGPTSGILTAQCNGTLYLYFNTDNFGACTGQYNVTFGSLATNVPANASSGVAAGSVTNGGVYSFSASGFCTFDSNGHSADPSGNPPSGPPANCFDFNVINITNAVCPAAKCFSLVGKIQ
jgi:hypothetical protein